MCDEFKCLPSEALREWRLMPCGVIEEILEARAYMKAKQALDSSSDPTDLPASPMLDRVKHIESALGQEAWERERGTTADA